MEIIIKSDTHGDKIVLIDSDDFDKIKKYKWFVSKNSNYIVAHDKLNHAKTIYLHRFIMDCPKDMQVDHINNDTLDNRKENLRICTQFENSKNQRKHKNNTSGYKGVSWAKKENKWIASIRIDGKKVRLGGREDLNEAILLYNEAAIKHHGEFARINKI